MNNEKKPKRVTVPEILARKQSKQKITTITAYDYTFARLLDEAGIDVILIGDSLSSVIQGHSNTLPVTVDEIIYHSKCVTAGVERAFCLADMPFLSYQLSKEKAVEAAGRLLKEGGVSAVKLEGGVQVAETIRHITGFDIPVMGHVGLTPQSYHRMGGHKVQGRNHDQDQKAGSYEKVLKDAIAVEEAGAFALVIECVPDDLAAEITRTLRIPTIGIGAGKDCDGQVLVMHDMLGLEDRRKPKFVKRYADLGALVKQATEQYIKDVQESIYPGEEHTFKEEAPDKSLHVKTKLTLV